MKTLKINGTKYKVYSSWDDVPIFKLHLLTTAAELFASTQDEKVLYEASMLTDIPLDILKSLPMKKIAKIYNYLKFAEVPPPNETVHKFKFNGKKYKVENPLTEDYFGKYVVVEEVVLKSEEIMESINNGEFRYYPKIIAAIVTEEGEPYSNRELDKRTEEFAHLPVPIALGVVGFFLQKSIKLNNTIRAYLNLQQKLQSTSKTLV